MMGFKKIFKVENQNSEYKFSRNDIKSSQLGKGITGSVDLYQSKTLPRFQYAVKTYHTKDIHESKKDYKTRVLYEYLILSELSHCNIIKIYDYDVSFSGSTIKLFLELGTANLNQLIIKQTNTFNINEMLCIWKQITNAVNYLHELDICHRDLKLENVVFDVNYKLIKVIDFATAQKLNNNELSRGLVGSESYTAPETYSSIQYDGKSSDVWSLGIILCYLINKKQPWKLAMWSNSDYQQFINQDNFLQEPYFVDFPVESLLLTSQILEQDPLRRIKINDFFSDKWFSLIQYCGCGVAGGGIDNKTCGIDHGKSFRVKT